MLSLAIIVSAGSAYSDTPVDWHKQYNDTCQGINLEGAMRYITDAKLTPRQDVVVAIIDTGLDTLTADVLPALWINPGERLDGIDNDGNGYIDDIHGWNFLGTPDGSFNMISAGTEEYREFKRLYPKYKDADSASVADHSEWIYYLKMRKKAGIDSYLKFYAYTTEKDNAYTLVNYVLNATHPHEADTASIATVTQLLKDDRVAGPAIEAIAVDLFKLGGSTPWAKAMQTHNDNFALMKKRINGIEHDADKRLLMGDDMTDETDTRYGNNILQADGCDHGTFVAGIIGGASSSGNPKVSGIFPQAKLMILRAVPEGDEYDKDVATAIRYAVDNGAKVINLSLGKLTSPQADMVNRAITYARTHDVLLLQAAGNSHTDIDAIPYFPSAVGKDGQPLDNYMRVGASSHLGGPASISNRGASKVDIFAPGDNVTSNSTGNDYMTASGTSIATPVASAVAAMVRAYYPELTAAEVKDILTSSCRPHRDLKGLCRSEGVLDAELAMRHAADRSTWNKVERLSSPALEPLLQGQWLATSWIDDGPRFNYSIKRNGLTEYYIADASTGKKSLMIKNPAKFKTDYVALTGDTLDLSGSYLYGLTFDSSKPQCFYFKRKDTEMCYNMSKGTLTKAPMPKSKNKDAGNYVHTTVSPDSTCTILGSGYDIYARDNATGKVTRLTHDGKKDASHTYRNQPDTTAANATGSWLGNRFLQTIYDNSEILETGFIESLGNDRPTVNSFKMPMPGDKGVRRYRVFWYNPETGESRYLPIEKYPDQTIDAGIYRSTDYVYFTRKSRKGDKIDLCRINVPDGTIDEVITENCEPHMNLSLFNYRVINDGKEIIWWSERTGRGNYYLYDRNGNLKNRITSGDSLVAGNIVRVDTVARTMVVCGYGNEPGVNPYYRQYYRASLDGKWQQPLTSGNYDHELNLSPSGKYAVVKYSRMDCPTAINALAVATPLKVHEIERMDVSPIVREGWKAPQLFTVKAADGVTDLPGLMYLPSDFDPEKKYPIITNVYPGPQSDQIPQSFAIDDNGNQSLAELGFVVINAPSRGSSPLRGRNFYTYGYGNLRDYPLADDKHTIEQLAARYSFIDLDRVGIYGHSGGAFQTVAAMLTYPDFYKVGVAASGNHDNNIYIQWWGEAFHGLDEVTDSVTGETTFHSTIPTNMELASNLKGHLMLITGDVDKNVSPSNTYRLADALIKEGKSFDMFVLPGKDHAVMCPYYQNLIRYYFKEHLTDPQPRHTNIVDHRP